MTVRHHDLGLLDHLAQELLEREFDDLDMVCGGVRAALPGRSTPASTSRLSSR
jgi:hypothetical protein